MTVNNKTNAIPETGIVSMPDAFLRGADLSGRKCDNIAGTDLIDANLDHTDFSGGTLKLACLVGANASRARFTSADLTCARLAAANLKNAKMGGVKLDRTDLRYANLGHAYMGHAQSDHARFDSALMVDVDMGDAQFSDTSFRDAVLHDAKVCGTSFDHCDMRDADISGMSFTMADIDTIRVNDDTDMRGASVFRSQVKQFVDPKGAPCSEEYLTALGALIIKK